MCQNLPSGNKLPSFAIYLDAQFQKLFRLPEFLARMLPGSLRVACSLHELKPSLHTQIPVLLTELLAVSSTLWNEYYIIWIVNENL